MAIIINGMNAGFSNGVPGASAVTYSPLTVITIILFTYFYLLIPTILPISLEVKRTLSDSIRRTE
jgi:hypothetical protein